MKKYICNRYPENPPAYKKENCFHQMSTLCNHDSEPCDATRYVRADVAIRYARMKEREVAIDFADWYAMQIYRGVDIDSPKTLFYGYKKKKEAQQAAKREGK